MLVAFDMSGKAEGVAVVAENSSDVMIRGS
jgi:hypothetical protein